MGANLRDRVVATRDTTTGTGVAKPKTLAEQIEAKKAVFQDALPDGAEARHLIRDAISLVRQQPQLAKCDVNTVLGGLMTFAQLGLRPGVLGHGWLIPFKKRTYDRDTRQWVETWEAQIVIGYKGYAELVYRTGSAMTMVSRQVHKHDEFDLAYGIEDRLVHRPAQNGPRGDVTGYYSVIKFQGGGYVFWYMTKAECEEWRDRYAMARKPIFDPETRKKVGEEIVGPWRDNFDAMALKTTFLRAQNLAPKTTQLARATAVDGGVRRDMGDADEMFFVHHPSPDTDNVIDGEVADDPEAGDDQILPDPATHPEVWHAERHPRRNEQGEILYADHAPDWCELCATTTTEEPPRTTKK